MVQLRCDDCNGPLHPTERESGVCDWCSDQRKIEEAMMEEHKDAIES